MPRRRRLSSIAVRMCRRETAAVGAGAHPPVDLRGDHDLLADREVRERPADELLARAIGVDVRRVERGDAELQRPPEEGPRLLFAHAPAVRAAVGRAEAHAAEDDRGDLQAAGAESVESMRVASVSRWVPSVAPAGGGAPAVRLHARIATSGSDHAREEERDDGHHGRRQQPPSRCRARRTGPGRRRAPRPSSPAGSSAPRRASTRAVARRRASSRRPSTRRSARGRRWRSRRRPCRPGSSAARARAMPRPRRRRASRGPGPRSARPGRAGGRRSGGFRGTRSRQRSQAHPIQDS